MSVLEKQFLISRKSKLKRRKWPKDNCAVWTSSSISDLYKDTATTRTKNRKKESTQLSSKRTYKLLESVYLSLSKNSIKRYNWEAREERSQKEKKTKLDKPRFILSSSDSSDWLRKVSRTIIINLDFQKSGMQVSECQDQCQFQSVRRSASNEAVILLDGPEVSFY